jgi:hypothetical protein
MYRVFPTIVENSLDRWVTRLVVPPVSLLEEQLASNEAFVHLSVNQLIVKYNVQSNLSPYELIQQGFWRAGILKHMQRIPDPVVDLELLYSIVDFPLALSQLSLMIGYQQLQNLPVPQTIGGRLFRDAILKTENLPKPHAICQTRQGTVVILDTKLLRWEEKGSNFNMQAQVDAAVALVSWFTRRPADTFKRPRESGQGVAMAFNQLISRYCGSHVSLYEGILFRLD